MVDERFELISLIFRLCPYDMFNGHKENSTAYQQELNAHFAPFSTHAAVQYAVDMLIGFDAIGHFALRMHKENGRFAMLPDASSIFSDDRWTSERVATFLQLANEFYQDTAFADFFVSHASYYEEEVQKFNDAQYGKIDFPWLEKYIPGKKLHVIFSPSLSRCNYAATIGNDAYAIVPHRCTLVHEFCHSFANPLAEQWYTEREDFRKLCDDSVDSERLAVYATGLTMAREYVTRAYHVLYDMQHDADSLEALLSRERDHNVSNSFPYMAQVYEMVLERENDTV